MSRFSVVILSAICLLSWTEAARATVVLEEHFENDSIDFTANSIWNGSYCADHWRSDLNDGVIASMDDGCGNCGCNFLVYVEGSDQCIQSDPFDNHIQAGNPYWQNYIYTVTMQNADDDAMGVIFRYENTATYYLFVVSNHMMPGLSTGCDEEFSGARLVRVRYDTGPEVLKSDPKVTFQPGQKHGLRITVNGKHIKVEFDKNANELFEAGEVFYDKNEKAAKLIPAGMVGLFAYQNGVTETGGDSAACAQGGCFFDDVSVDLLPPTSDNCGDIGWEGACKGNALSFCDQLGELQLEQCSGGECCGWVASEGFFSCLPPEYCGNACSSNCQAADSGCSANLDQAWSCGQGDGDPCLEPVFLHCNGLICNPATGACEEPCEPDCTGQECGDDGCGGNCGQCTGEDECINGTCQQKVPGKLGDPCEAPGDCALAMCVQTELGKLCSKACSGDAACPKGFLCLDVKVNNMPLQACVPSGECFAECAGKECGPDGCDGSCGSCDDGFSCKAGHCKPDSGATCGVPDDCASGLCLTFQSGTFCTNPCSTDAGCPDGWECSPWLSATTPHLCAPPSTMVAHEHCADVANCATNCPPNTPACISSCFFMGSDDAKTQYSDLFVCAELNCLESCPGEQDDCLGQCLLDTCFQSFAICFPGTLTCQESLTCMIDCDGAQSCVSSCYEAAFPVSKKQLSELFSCVDKLCPEGSTGGCLTAAIEGPCLADYDACSDTCEAVCGDLECGEDGCGGSCGKCGSGQVCDQGTCQTVCNPQCDGLECGDDGCNGSCGDCPDGLECTNGICHDGSECLPHDHVECVDNDLYWFDSCGSQEQMAEQCSKGCGNNACLGSPDDADAISGMDDSSPGNSAAGGQLMTFDAGASKGCSAGSTSQTMTWVLCLLLAGTLWMRRRHHA
jgi:hypothetical protein